MIDILKHTINADAPIKSALDKLNQLPSTLTLFVVDQDETLIGTLTDGDIRRGLLKNKDLNSKVSEFVHDEFCYLQDAEIDYKNIRSYKEALPLFDT